MRVAGEAPNPRTGYQSTGSLQFPTILRQPHTEHLSNSFNGRSLIGYQYLGKSELLAVGKEGGSLCDIGDRYSCLSIPNVSAIIDLVGYTVKSS